MDYRIFKKKYKSDLYPNDFIKTGELISDNIILIDERTNLQKFINKLSKKKNIFYLFKNNIINNKSLYEPLLLNEI